MGLWEGSHAGIHVKGCNQSLFNVVRWDAVWSLHKRAGKMEPTDLKL